VPTLTQTDMRMLTLTMTLMAGFARRLAVLALLCVAGTSHAAEIYRWVDEGGVVNYTQQKPRNIAVQALTTQAGSPTTVREQPATAPVGEPGATTQPEMIDAQQRMLEALQAKEQARQQEIAEIREENCGKSRSVLSDLSAKERIRVRGNDGMERIMAEDERQRRISEAQQGIVENCASV
jgi:hypothetical protein